MADDDTPTTAQSMLGANYTQSAKPGGDGSQDYRKPVDSRYMQALREQKAQRAKLTPRRRPMLRLVWDRDAQTQEGNS